MQPIWALLHLVQRQGFYVQLTMVGYMGSHQGHFLCYRPSQSSVGSQTQLHHGDPHEYSSGSSAHADTDIRAEENKSAHPPNIHQSHTHTPKSAFFPADHNGFPYPVQQRLFKGSLYHHCQLFPATCKNPFHYCGLLAALTMWEGFSASTLRPPPLLGHVHLSTPLLPLLCSPLFMLSFQGED